jgi:putative tryptophan/tyrosine transport system ATP-binding protein
MRQACRVFESVSCVLGQRTVLTDLSVSINKGDFIVLVGKNGSGKSTFLKLCQETLAPTSGIIHYHDRRQGQVAACTQSPLEQLCPSMTIKEHVTLYHPKMAFDEVKEELASFHPHLSTHTDTPVGHFSGGEQQALVLALILLSRPQLLLLDEHTSALDPGATELIMEITQRNIQRYGVTCVMTTHHMDVALQYGNRLLALQDGRITHDYNQEEKLLLCAQQLMELCYV